MYAYENEIQAMLRESAREFAVTYLVPHAKKWDTDDYCPKELWPILGELGFLGLFAAAEQGDPGLGLSEQAIVMEELALFDQNKRADHQIAAAKYFSRGARRKTHHGFDGRVRHYQRIPRGPLPA